MHDIAPSPDPGSRNAFAPVFLHTFGQRDEPLSAAEADLAGPWEVRRSRSPHAQAPYSVWRQGERAAWGDRPAGEFADESTAVLACALRPHFGVDPLHLLGGRRQARGFPLTRGGEPSGWIELFEEGWVAGLNLLERVVRSPEALALVMEAAGPLALERAGRILHERVLPEEPEAGGSGETGEPVQ